MTQTSADQVLALAVLLHLSQRAESLIDGPFKVGFEMAIEEAAAYLQLKTNNNRYTVYCSSCGGEFNHNVTTGFSHCEDHKEILRVN